MSQFRLWYAELEEVADEAIEALATRHLSAEEAGRVRAFRFEDDRKRCLLSHLLQHALVRDALGLAAHDYSIQRNRENKPYLEVGGTSSGFNFNVSHHGKYVCIASHASLKIGVDIVDADTRSSLFSGAAAFIDVFSAQFTELEARAMLDQPTEALRYSHFYANWSLKEAYVKALGVGLACDLRRVRLEVPPADVEGFGRAALFLEGEPRDDWRCEFFRLDARHIVSVARGAASPGEWGEDWEPLPQPQRKRLADLLAALET